MQSEKGESNFKFGAQIINAGCAGFIGISFVYPLNLIKFIVHNQTGDKAKERTHTRIVDCCKNIYRRHGLRGLYNGFTTNASFIVPEKTIKLVVNEYLRSVLKKTNEPLPLQHQMLAAAGAGTCQLIVTIPMELFIIKKALTTADEANVKITSTWENLKKTVHEKGTRGLYQGATATWCRDVFFSMIYFPLFYYLNEQGRPKDSDKVPFYHTLASGMFSGAVAAYFATPFDLIKTRIQSVDSTTPNSYKGVIDCAKKIYHNEPLKTFMTGSVLRVIAIAPLFGIVQTVFFLGIGETVLGIFEPKQ